MKSFRSWLTWIFKGRAVLCGLMRDLQEQISEYALDRQILIQRIDDLDIKVAKLTALQPQSVAQSKPVTKHRSFREFQAQVEREEANAD